MTLRPAATIGGAAVGVGAGWWATRHLRSLAVRGWQPSRIPGESVGSLHVRHGGHADPVVVLLHGLIATGDVFGAAFDSIADSSTLVVPDLLGFGRSLDESRGRFAPEDHLDALDEMLDALGIAGRPIIIGAHSMGGSVAVRWARRRGAQVQRVVCWGPPVYPDADAVDTALADSGVMTKLFVANTTWARIACEVNCAYRTPAGLAAAALSPSLPRPIARAASLHTWPAYRDAMDHLVAGTDWGHCLHTIDAAGTTVELTWGSNDRIGDRDHARTLRPASVEIVEGAGHHLPLTHGDRCRSQLFTDPA